MMQTMKKKLTLLIFDATGTPVRQTTIPKILIPLLVLIVSGAVITLCFGVGDYLRLKAETKHIHQLQLNLTAREERIVDQQNQIVTFARKIDALKGELADLHDFEQKIRIVANLEVGADKESIFGVGGSDPEDLDPATVIEQDYQELVRDMHAEINAIDQTSQSQHQSFTSIFSQLEGKRNLLAATPSIRPVKGWISSCFGNRESPFTNRREFHHGLDIATQAGSPVHSPADGLITFAGRKGLMGNMVTIEHGFGMVTRYGHLHRLLKQKGDRVKRGEIIALVGNTGRSTGPHLHYEVRLNGAAVNPMNYFLN